MRRLMDRQVAAGMTRSVYRIGPGSLNRRIEYRWHANAPSTSEIDRIVRLVQNEINLNSRDINFPINSTFMVYLEGNLTPGGVAQNRKSFEDQSFFNIDSFVTDFENWAEGFINLGGADYSIELSLLRIDIIRGLRGGCSSRKRTKRFEEDVYQAHKSKEGDCFFACLHALIQSPECRPSQWGTLRQQCNLRSGEPVSVRSAIHYLKRYAPHKKVIVRTRNPDGLHYGEQWQRGDANVTELLCTRGHWYVYLHTLEKRKCPLCNRHYRKTHTCRANQYPCCKRCHHFHGIHETCPRPRLILPHRRCKANIQHRKQSPVVIHYDIETHTQNELNEHEPYAVGCVDTGGDYHVFVGRSCMSDFLVLLLSEARALENQTLILNAYNGANFDHYALIRELIQQGIPIDELQLNNGSIIMAKFVNVRCWDLCKHLIGSLKHNLDSWKCKTQKGDFPHELATAWEDMPFDLREKCLFYLKTDVLGLQELYERVSQSVLDYYEVHLVDYLSTSHMTYQVWLARTQPSFKKYGLYLPNHEDEHFYRNSIYGGRCYKSKHCFISEQRQAFLDGVCSYEDVDDYLLDMDVVSLYPAAMMCTYPIGKPIYVNYKGLILQGNMEFPSKRLGIYHIQFKAPKTLAHAILPTRDERGLLRWELGAGSGFYNTVDLMNALEYGYIITFTDLGGYEFPGRTPIFKDYIGDLFKVKQTKTKGTPEYMLAKLLMNGLYGKLHQRPIYDETFFCDTLTEFWGKREEYRIMEMDYVGEQMMVKGIRRDVKQLQKQITKPSYLASFVLAYSRSIMLRYMTSFNDSFRNTTTALEKDFYYTDTDSLHIHQKQCDVSVCHKGLGGISSDIGDAKIIRALYIAPKLYMLEYIIPQDQELHYHFRGKGVAMDQLNTQVFELMHHGESVNTYRPFQIKRIHTRMSAEQEEHIQQFSLLHFKREKTLRILNTIPWKNRTFIGNHSIPQLSFK